ARVNIDYHVEIERHYYSVPYALVHHELDVRYTAMTVEIFHRGQRVASHARSYKIGSHTTIDAPSAEVASALPGVDAAAIGPLGLPAPPLLPPLWSIRFFNPAPIANRASAVVWAFCVWEKPTAPNVWKPRQREPAISMHVPTKV